jgi:hypothetical protein
MTKHTSKTITSFFAKSIFFCIITLGQKAFAQDKLISKQGDTVQIVVSLIDKMRIVYHLKNDPTKTEKEALTEDLHKIIWRNGKEYVFDEIFDKNKKEVLLNREMQTKKND